MRKSANNTIPRSWQLLFLMALLAVLVLVLGQRNAAASSQPEPAEPDGIPQLIDDTGGAVEISMNEATGVASFVRLTDAAALSLNQNRSASAEAAGEAFFKQYGGVFGVTDADSELVLVDAAANRMVDGVQLTYQQLYEDVPVFAAVMKARFDSQHQVTSVNGTFVPKISVTSTTPRLSAAEADRIAVQTVADQNDASRKRLRSEESGVSQADGRSTPALAANNNGLYVFRSGLVQGVSGQDYLVYEVEVTNSNVSVREFVYVDAQKGAVVDQITGIYHGLDREVSEDNLANVVWVEGDDDPIPPAWMGGTAQQVLDWQNEIDGARETYNIFASMAGWDSYDNAGATMRTVNNDPNISCPNANWNGISTNYCSDVTGDDTVAHEWGHAYTDHTNNLIYQWQSGALNESYSDIWGDVVDLLNGRDIDTPDVVRPSDTCSSNVAGANFPGNPTIDTVRWLSGESDPAFNNIPTGSGNAIRDMWDPTCFGDPGKVTDVEYHCAIDDSGGVHTNSGVPNRAFALLVDGDPALGVDAIGLTKAAHIHWGAQTMLTPASNFVDHADALEASCSALIGIDLPALSTSVTDDGLSGEVISAADCQEVTEVIDIVQFRTPPDQCQFSSLLDPDAPPLCEGLGETLPIASEDFEGGSLPAGWAVGAHSVANPPTFDTPDWSVVDNLPAGANGTYAAFVPNLIIGDCGPDDESGALFLDSPAMVVPAGVVPHVAFDHWVATEPGWDGGNIKVSVNGGPWTLVPAGSFEFNAYNANINGGGNTNPLAGEEAFTGGNGGEIGGSWGQSQVNLAGLAAAGDSVKLRFDFGIDGCNGSVGWFVDEVEVYACSDEEGPVCGDAILDAGESCDDGNTANGDGCSSSCQVESGWSCVDPIPPASGANVLDDGSFEAGAFGGFWDEYSLNFGSPICDAASCGTGTGTGASDGAFWTWFGGIDGYEEGSVSQVVTIPATASDLTFDLEQIVCDSDADYMELLVDGNQEFVSTGGSDLCGTLGYATQTVDMSGYADGAQHLVDFHSEVFANNIGITNFFVDDVILSDNLDSPPIPSVCTPLQDDVACNAGTVGFDDGIPGSWTVVDNTGSGLVWTNVVDSGEAGNFTGGAGDAASASSDVFGPAEYDTELRSNVFDLTNASAASLDYLASYANFGNLDYLDLDITADGGATWTNLLSWNDDHGNFRGTPGEAVNIDLTAYLGMSNLQLRWRYYDPNGEQWDWYAQVDDVSLTCDIAAEPELINELLNLEDVATSYDPAPAPNAPAGIYTISSTFMNVGTVDIEDIHFEVAVLDRNNLLLNADGGPGGAGAVLSVPASDLGADGVLTPGESFDVDFEIGLNQRRAFSFFVDAYGVPSGNFVTAPGLSSDRGYSFEIDSGDLGMSELFIPLVSR